MLTYCSSLSFINYSTANINTFAHNGLGKPNIPEDIAGIETDLNSRSHAT